MEFDDLYQTGYLAMVAAVESYRSESGAFSTWFMFYLKTAFAEATGYRTKYGRCEPLNTATSLDRPIQPDEPGGGNLAEFVSDGKAEAAIAGVEQSVYHKQLHEAMEAAIGELPPENAPCSTPALLGQYDSCRRWKGHGKKFRANAANGKQGNPGVA